MLTSEEIENWNEGYEVDQKDVIVDLFRMYLWSGETLPYQELIRILKQESGSKSSLYGIAVMLNEVMADDPHED